MISNIKIRFLALKSRKNDSLNESPLYARITINGKRSELATGRFVDFKKWDSKSQRVKGSGEYAETLNTFLHNYKNNLLSVYNSLILKLGAEGVSSVMVSQNLRGTENKSEHTLLEAFKYNNQMIKKSVGINYAENTYKQYVLAEKRIKLFIKEFKRASDVNLSEVNPEFYDNFRAYLATNFTCKHNRIVRYLKQLKFVMNKAVELGWIERSLIDKCKSSEKPSNRVALTEAELFSIENKSFGIERLQIIKDMFIFSVYTGISYADMYKLKPDDVTVNINGEKSVLIYRQKTNTRCFIPLLPKAVEILDKYKDFPRNVSQNKLLPVCSNQRVNSYLKEIQDLCGIKKNLTFHLARHTFATTIALSNGVPLETIKNLLGHSSIKTTEIYGKINDQKVNNDMMALKNKLTTSESAMQPQKVALK